MLINVCHFNSSPPLTTLSYNFGLDVDEYTTTNTPPPPPNLPHCKILGSKIWRGKLFCGPKALLSNVRKHGLIWMCNGLFSGRVWKDWEKEWVKVQVNKQKKTRWMFEHWLWTNQRRAWRCVCRWIGNPPPSPNRAYFTMNVKLLTLSTFKENLKKKFCKIARDFVQ